MPTPTHLQCISDTDIPQPPDPAWRRWPGCLPAMLHTIQLLTAEGAAPGEVARALALDYPSLTDAQRHSVIERERMALLRHPLRCVISEAMWWQGAEQVLDTLHSLGCDIRRSGDNVDVFRRDKSTRHQLTDELKDQVWRFKAELYELADDVRLLPVQPVLMSPGLAAFAGGQGCVCAYCDRVGDARGDPDGAAWHKDHVPSLRTANPFVLACSACRARPDRARLLEGADV